ncbi:MAG: SBBP repeat-containing protein [candidate division WOR-3 bacterium]|nr:SBBP repeat-containing protein [candidate division WOR-3 bacterium]
MPDNKNNTLILVLLIMGLTGLFTLVKAQVSQVWARRWTSAGSFADYAYVMTIDNSGNVYVAGSMQTSSSNSRAQVIKYNTNGDTLWRWTDPYPGTFLERASSITVAPSGNVYICGHTMRLNAGDYLIVKLNGQTGDTVWLRTYDAPGSGGYDFARRIVLDADENVYVTGYGARSGYGYYDIVTVKYNSNGAFQWEAFYDGGVTGIDHGYSIFINETGLYVTGYSNATASGNTDMVIIKYNSANGNEIWARRFNGSADGNDYGRDIVADALGNVYVTGSLNNTGTSSDLTTIKLNSSGDTVWLRAYNGTYNLADIGYWIKLDGSGYVYVYGTTYSPISVSNMDLCLIKFNAVNGNVVWLRTYNGPAVVQDTMRSYENCPDESGQNGMAIDALGNIYLTGRSTYIGAPYTGHTDILTLKYNPNGELLWTMRYNHPAMDTIHQGQSVAVDNAHNVYVAGYGRGVNPATYIDWVTIKYTQPVAITEKAERISNLNFNVYPNPINKKSIIHYIVPNNGQAVIKLYNALGRLVKTISEGNLNAGSYTTSLGNITRGVYFLRYECEHNRQQIKLTVN